jgi:hypothetical protein
MYRFLAVFVLTTAAFSTHADAARQPTFDWTKPTVKGNILGTLRPTIRNDMLDLGIGKIPIGKSPHRDQFVREGALALFFPNLKPKKAAPKKAARKKAARKKALRKKIAAKSAPLLPGPGTGYRPRNEAFARLAAAVSGKYKMPGRNTHRNYKVQRQEAARAGSDYPVLGVQKYAQAMLAKSKEVRAINVAAVRASLSKEAQAVERRIASGDYTRRDLPP